MGGKCPLELLQQTCASIGRESPPTGENGTTNGGSSGKNAKLKQKRKSQVTMEESDPGRNSQKVSRRTSIRTNMSSKRKTTQIRQLQWPNWQRWVQSELHHVKHHQMYQHKNVLKDQKYLCHRLKRAPLRWQQQAQQQLQSQLDWQTCPHWCWIQVPCCTTLKSIETSEHMPLFIQLQLRRPCKLIP